MVNFIQNNFIKINLNKNDFNETEVASMFIGRERELASLKKFYEKDGTGMTVIYGRSKIYPAVF